MNTVTPPERVYVYTFSDPQNALVSNGIDQLHLHAVSDGKLPVICTFKRAEGTGNPPNILSYDRPVPSRIPSALPPLGNLSLRLNIGPHIGRGRTSDVYDVAIDPPNTSPELSAFAVPPLVIKTSRPGREQAMANEAFFYEEMESLQGIVIPRYYGFFKGELPAGYRLAGDEPVRHDRVDREDDLDSDGVDHSGSTDEGGRSYSPMRDAPHNIQQLDGPRPITILVLEKLGEGLPVGKPLPSNLTPEMRDMYAHLSHLGIDHVDVRYSNILEAPPCPPGWSCLVSPRTKMAYRYRLIDFDNSTKTNRPLDAFDSYYMQYITRLVDGLPLGYVIEPWEI